jgi:hypothetical protein
MTIGSGIAIAGIWLSVAVIARGRAGAGVIVGFFAPLATCGIAGP